MLFMLCMFTFFCLLYIASKACECMMSCGNSPEPQPVEGTRISVIANPDLPPSYEPPPEYADVIKTKF
jgi:hypothetical protein